MSIALSINDEDDKFTDRLEIELNKLILQSNSPLTMSAANSDCDDDDSNNSDDNNDIHIRKSTVKYRKLSYKDVEHSMNRYYNTDKSVGEMDTLIAHIKCQKILYIEAKNYTQYRLNSLIIPSVLIATLITVITPFIVTRPRGSYIITSMNAVTTLLLSLMNHLKLETNAKNYEQIAVRYDKLQSSLELFSTKIIFSHDGIDFKSVLHNKLKEVEDKLLEIKEQNDMLIPEDVKRKFPIISNINIFSTINAIEMHRKTFIEQLRSVKNEIRFIHAKWNESDSGSRQKEEARMKFLFETKETLRNELLKHSNAFSYINEIFQTELEKKPQQPPGKLIKFI